MTGSTGSARGNRAYRFGVAVAVAASILMIWTTIVHDDGNGIGFFMLIMAAAVGGAACRFRPDGLARTMLGVAIMQALLGVAIAAAPPTVSTPNGSFAILAYCGVFIALWLTSAALFRAAAKAGESA